jgi:hypothetical protein
MRQLGHEWTRATVSEVENEGRIVGTNELVALALVLDRTPLDLLDPTGLDGREVQNLDFGGPDERHTFPAVVVSRWMRGELSSLSYADGIITLSGGKSAMEVSQALLELQPQNRDNEVKESNSE